jgi:uncharacterized repeat protein (TIGR04076 family)
MADRYDIKVKVISQKGECGAGHKVGDEWLITNKTPEGICLSAFNAIYPNIRTMMFGGTFPWGKEKDVTTLACPDASNPVVFEVRRVKSK